MTSVPTKTTVVKIGGTTFDDHGDNFVVADIVALQRLGRRMVVVHGGGKLVTEWLDRQGVETRFVRGERVTDRPALEVATAVLGGLVNKEIVAAINCLGGRAVGISGVDGALAQSRLRKNDIDMGFVGEVVTVDATVLEALLDAGFVPVVSPVSLHAVDRADGAPRILNVNGDPLAGEIAAALGAEKLVFLTDVDGISDKSGQVVSHLSPEEAERLVASGVASGGMIPKVNACLRALASGGTACIIDGRGAQALLGAVDGEAAGTTIRAEGNTEPANTRRKVVINIDRSDLLSDWIKHFGDFSAEETSSEDENER